MADVEHWQELLRSSGHRLTRQRELVLEAIEELGHATPDQVFAAVRRREPGVNLSTVYRTLELLNDLALIRHTHLSDRAPTYHSATASEHAHLICRECGTQSSVEREEIAAALDPITPNFAPDYGHLAIFGVCATCLSRSQ